MAKVFEGKLLADGLRFGIVISRFNEFITKKLLEGALDALARHGAAEDNIAIAWVLVLLKIQLLQRKWQLLADMTP